MTAATWTLVLLVNWNLAAVPGFASLAYCEAAGRMVAEALPSLGVRARCLPVAPEGLTLPEALGRETLEERKR